MLTGICFPCSKGSSQLSSRVVDPSLSLNWDQPGPVPRQLEEVGEPATHHPRCYRGRSLLPDPK